MAEKYGSIPKKFTKKWWEYFWLYYKWYVIIPLAIILIIVFTIYSKINTEKFDITLTYAGKMNYAQEMTEKLEKELSLLCSDVDGNGKKSLQFNQFNLSDDIKDAEYTMAMNTKLQLAFSEDDTYIFILDEETARRYQGEDKEECVFAPLKDWLDSDISVTNAFTAHGENYGVDISDCELFKSLNMDVSGHYLFIRYYPRKDQIEKQLPGYEASIELANKILLQETHNR